MTKWFAIALSLSSVLSCTRSVNDSNPSTPSPTYFSITNSQLQIQGTGLAGITSTSFTPNSGSPATLSPIFSHTATNFSVALPSILALPGLLTLSTADAQTIEPLSVLSTLTIDGNVGIGTTTPNSNLSFTGQSAQTLGMERESTAVAAGHNLTISAGGAVSGGNNLNGGDLILNSGIATGTGTSNIYFATAPGIPDSAGATDYPPVVAMTINGSGFVGIGTTTPITGLQVWSNDGSGIAASFSTSSTANAVGIGVLGNSAAIEGLTAGAGNADLVLNPFGLNVGIGTSTPQATLDVQGFLRLKIYSGSPPVACSSTFDGAIAATAHYTTCICKGGSSAWVLTADGSTPCTW